MNKLINTHKYDDIISLDRPDSGRHAHMSMVDRGAQFSPFAALTGYDDVIRETGRLTQQDTDLTDSGIDFLDEALRRLESRIAEQPWVMLTYFLPDTRKEGGSIQSITGQVKKLDLYTRSLILTDQREIPFYSLKTLEILE